MHGVLNLHLSIYLGPYPALYITSEFLGKLAHPTLAYIADIHHMRVLFQPIRRGGSWWYFTGSWKYPILCYHFDRY